jgi:hypothetical protein
MQKKQNMVEQEILKPHLLRKKGMKQKAEGKNLALKVPGTRGATDSAGELAIKKYGIDLNSAHVIADWFMGTGYKKGANLILTSKEFNQETMRNAEESIQQQIKDVMNNHKDSIVTFDMTVSATFDVLEDDGIIGALKHNFASLKNQKAIDLALEKAKQILQGKQEPRKCEKVEYLAFIYVNGIPHKDVFSETKEGDKWLKNLFDK